MKANTPELMKFKRLERRLGESRRGTIGLLEGLWISVAKNCPQGDIGRFSNEEIAIMCDWEGDHDELVAALVDCRWLDQCEAHRMVVHDWNEHCPTYVKGGLARKNQAIAIAKTSEVLPDGDSGCTSEVLPGGDSGCTSGVLPDGDSGCTSEVLTTKPSQAKPSQAISLSSDSDGERETTLPSPTDVMGAWNRSRAAVKVRSMTPDRAAKLRTRLKDANWPWREAIAMLPIPNTDRFTWQPDFDWLIANSTNAIKLVEGKYSRQQAAAVSPSTSPPPVSKPMPMLRPKAVTQ